MHVYKNIHTYSTAQRQHHKRMQFYSAQSVHIKPIECIEVSKESGITGYKYKDRFIHIWSFVIKQE